MKLLQQSKRMLSFALKLAVYPLSSVIPRSDNQWVFGHDGGDFAGNPKYFFLWMALNRPDIRIIWITGNSQTHQLLKRLGYHVSWRWSPRGIWAALTGKVFVIDDSVYDVNFLFSRNVLLINLWHGIGLKTVGRERGGAVKANTNSLADAFLGGVRKAIAPRSSPDVLVTTSDFMQAHFSEQCGLPVERCPQLGYPRLDFSVDKLLYASAIQLDRETGFELKPDEFSEVYFYMPTWRESGRNFFAEALPDVQQLSEILLQRNALLYIKPHPYTAGSIPVAPNIRAWPREIDFQPYLVKITGLITDYSSVLYDYLFMTSGAVVLYTFDQDRYVSSDRTLRYDYDANVAGWRAKTFAELCKVFRNGTAAKPLPQNEVDRINHRFWGGTSVPASPAIAAHITQRLREEE